MTTLEAPPWSPDCMEPVDWADWQKFNDRTGGGKATRPCVDCPASYAAEMRAVGRCNGTPSGDMSNNGLATLPRPAVLTGRELPVNLTLPCLRCAHESVCRIKPQLEARLETLPVTLPQLDRMVTVVVSAEVHCTEFLKAAAIRKGPKNSSAKPAVVARQARVVEALREADGNAMAAARATGIEYKVVQNDIRGMRGKGTLPADIEALLAQRRAERLA